MVHVICWNNMWHLEWSQSLQKGIKMIWKSVLQIEQVSSVGSDALAFNRPSPKESYFTAKEEKNVIMQKEQEQKMQKEDDVSRSLKRLRRGLPRSCKRFGTSR
ncbi:hypothetical protein AXF42_Ash009317 [Apostasia shenzhenica]|uniref:Uncharacterized protein n=1 Tax=Apostasia shenzhenica TaxID=1088818 RepID=A0A2I0B3R4_9ASPA|nr:hypothetical protein AXF42_Ash009317 [Apostasia shenzhenica]